MSDDINTVPTPVIYVSRELDTEEACKQDSKIQLEAIKKLSARG